MWAHSELTVGIDGRASPYHDHDTQARRKRASQVQVGPGLKKDLEALYYYLLVIVVVNFALSGDGDG